MFIVYAISILSLWNYIVLLLYSFSYDKVYVKADWKISYVPINYVKQTPHLAVTNAIRGQAAIQVTQNGGGGGVKEYCPSDIFSNTTVGKRPKGL